MLDNISLSIRKEKGVHKLYATSDNGTYYLGVCNTEDKGNYNWEVQNYIIEINEVLGQYYVLRAYLKEMLKHRHSTLIE